MAGGEIVFICAAWLATSIVSVAFIYGVARLVERATSAERRPGLPPLSVYGDFPAVPSEAKARTAIASPGEEMVKAARAQRTSHGRRTPHDENGPTS